MRSLSASLVSKHYKQGWQVTKQIYSSRLLEYIYLLFTCNEVDFLESTSTCNEVEIRARPTFVK